MDISQINANEVTTEQALLIGSAQAPVKLVEFMNARCPFCKKWFEESLELLTEAVDKGQVQRVIKLFDKEKPSLQRGNVMHRFVNHQDTAAGFTALQAIYETQAQWGELSLDEVAEFAQTKLNLTETPATEILAHTVQEATAANIKFVPTLVIGEHIFDEAVSLEQLQAYITENH